MQVRILPGSWETAKMYSRQLGLPGNFSLLNVFCHTVLQMKLTEKVGIPYFPLEIIALESIESYLGVFTQELVFTSPFLLL